MEASGRGYTDTVKALLAQSGVDVNLQNKVNTLPNLSTVYIEIACHLPFIPSTLLHSASARANRTYARSYAWKLCGDHSSLACPFQY